MLIKNGTVIMEDAILTGYDVRVQDGHIVEIGEKLIGDESIYDATDLYVCPGFVDIHTHGGGGGDFMDATEESFEKALRFHCKNGTTSLLATSVTAAVEEILEMVTFTRIYRERKESPCRILGVHLEGPYLSYKNKGAQKASDLRIPARDSYDFILENSDVVKTVTIAPELEGAVEMIKKLREQGIIVCGGHDDGEKKLILPAIEAGLSHCTHLWCAMSTVAMRNGIRTVGLCELGLTDKRLSVEIIADNYHITSDMTKLIYQCKGAKQMCVVSDSLRAGGMPVDGTTYSLGSQKNTEAQKFVVSDGVARMLDGSHYAGSIQPVGMMVRHLVQDCDIPLIDAVRMGSLTPAEIIGEDKIIGSIKVGKKADLCLLDKDYKVQQTFINGKAMLI